MGSGFDERSDSCTPYLRVRVVALKHWFTVQGIGGRELIKGVRFQASSMSWLGTVVWLN